MVSEKMVSAWNYPNRPMAEIGKYRLQLNSIDAEIFDGGLDTLYAGALGGVQLRVRESDLEKAKSLLDSSQEVEEEGADEKEEINASKKYCHHCHSTRVDKKALEREQSQWPWVNWFHKWMGPTVEWTCGDCGGRWRE